MRIYNLFISNCRLLCAVVLDVLKFYSSSVPLCESFSFPFSCPSPSNFMPSSLSSESSSPETSAFSNSARSILRAKSASSTAVTTFGYKRIMSKRSGKTRIKSTYRHLNCKMSIKLLDCRLNFLNSVFQSFEPVGFLRRGSCNNCNCEELFKLRLS